MKTKKPPKILPIRRDPAQTRQKILDCATYFFSRSGYEGASLSEILEKAKVNKRMVYHYYGNKEGLYRAVHIHQWQLLLEWFTQSIVSARAAETSPPNSRELLMKALEIFHDFSATHQDFLRLLMWDGLEGGEVSRAIWKEIRGPIYYQMESLVQSAQDHGFIGKDLKVDHLIVSFMGAIMFYFTYANSLEDIFSKDPLSERAVSERKQQSILLFEKIFSEKKK